MFREIDKEIKTLFPALERMKVRANVVVSQNSEGHGPLSPLL